MSAIYDANEYLIAGLENQAEWWEHLGDAHRDYAALAREAVAAEARCARLQGENALLLEGAESYFKEAVAVFERRAEAAEAAAARLRDGLREIRREEWTRVRSGLIAVLGHLDAPYPDDPRWTPWTRFVEPALKRMDEAIRALLAEDGAPPIDGETWGLMQDGAA